MNFLETTTQKEKCLKGNTKKNQLKTKKER